MFWALLVSAIALSVERTCYVWIAQAPRRFSAWCAVARLGEPVVVVRRLFYGFKVAQLSVFAGWCGFFGRSGLAVSDTTAFLVGGVLMLSGQALNWSVFYRLGVVGVFYGDRLGYDVPHCRDFPFSLLRHPQYVGAVLSIWGFFVATRFPHDDWVLLPVLETVYYVIGTYLEERGPARPGPMPRLSSRAVAPMEPSTLRRFSPGAHAGHR